ncbi:uncharacterized transporter YycB [Arthrobacter sp. Hiyo4]|nr:uncharacterized transporter YycB [Arthrobacter sp. Hiyo4]
MSGQFLAKVPKGWILLACIGLLALNLRGPFVAVAPVVDLMQADLGFTPVMLGLLTSIPVLCFALAASLASLTTRKLGAEFAVSLTILGVLAGVIVRSAGGPGPVVVGTVMIGLAITVGNIAVPLIIRRDFSPLRQGTAMGVYTAALNIGSFLTSMVTAPLAELAGWRVALVSVGILAVIAIVFWTLAVGARTAFVPSRTVVAGGQEHPAVKGSGWITAGLTAGFAGQAFSYYAVTAWLPSYLNDELGMSASAAGQAHRCSRSSPLLAAWECRSRPNISVRRRRQSPWGCCGQPCRAGCCWHLSSGGCGPRSAASRRAAGSR